MFFPIILLVFSSLTHLLFFGYPHAVVFDETYMGSFVSSYATGSYYFDIHPPLAKLIEKFFGDMIGTIYNADFSAIGNSLPWEVVLLRLLPVIAGILLPVVIYFICRHLNFSKIASFTAGILIILENSLLTQSRFILFDSMMILFGFMSILIYQTYLKRNLDKKFLILSALFAAGAFSIKWTGFAFPLFIFIMEMIRVAKARGGFGGLVKFASIYAFIGIFIYCNIFSIHFNLLNKTGTGDLFMTDRFQKTLMGNRFENDPNVKAKGFFGKIIEINQEMYMANATLTKTHQYSSKWYTWPLMLRPIFYWEDQSSVDTTGKVSYIYLLGNPIIYWLGILSILFILGFSLSKKRNNTSLFIAIGFLVNLLPFALITRAMFLYHYEAALVFSIIGIAYVIDMTSHKKVKNIVAVTLIVVCSITFLYFAPLSYGLPLTDSQIQDRMWLSTWR